MSLDAANAKRELARLVNDRFERYREGRRPFEARWEEAYYNTLGEYAPGITGQWRAREAVGSRIFVRLTRQKVREACRRVEPSLRQLRFDLVSADTDPSVLSSLKGEIERALNSGRVGEKLTSMAWDAAWSGTGILRAPVLAQSARPSYGQDPATGLWNASAQREDYPAVEMVSVWNFYPDPDAPSIEEGEGVIQLHRLYPHQLRALVARAGYDAQTVSRIIERGLGAPEEDWERSLRAAVGRAGLPQGGRERVGLLEYWGSVDTDLLRRAGACIPDDAGPDVEAVIVVAGDEVLKCAQNPWEPGYRPYLAFRWEPVPHQFWGVGVAENVRDSQKMINGASRLLVDNKALAGNCMFEIDVESLVPGQDLSSVFPGKKWVLRPGARGPAVRPVLVPDVSGVLLEMIELFQGYAEASSGVATPPGLEAGAPNATGLSIALSASGEGLRSVIRRLDEEIVEPLVERVYRWIMEYGDPDLPKGPARVRAVSTATAQAKEIRSQRLLDFMGMMSGKLGALPVGGEADQSTLAGRIDLERLLEEMADALDIREILRPRASSARTGLGE